MHDSASPQKFTSLGHFLKNRMLMQYLSLQFHLTLTQSCKFVFSWKKEGQKVKYKISVYNCAGIRNPFARLYHTNFLKVNSGQIKKK